MPVAPRECRRRDVRAPRRRRRGGIHGASFPLSYTERKRIRKSFGKRERAQRFPYLLTMQKARPTSPSCKKDMPPAHAASPRPAGGVPVAFPIVSHNGMVEMKFIEYNIANRRSTCASASSAA